MKEVTEAELTSEAEKLARKLFSSNAKSFIALKGPLGAGKTTFARAFIKAWLTLDGEKNMPNITSPTYTIAQVYGFNQKLAHLDLYRLESTDDFFQAGFEIYFQNYRCCLVEWVDKIFSEKNRSLLPPKIIWVQLDLSKNIDKRLYELKEEIV